MLRRIPVLTGDQPAMNQTVHSTPATLQTLRDQARDLINEFDAADGLASYYTLHHDPQRTRLTIHRSPDGQMDGFLTQCTTGIDLFRPIVTLRVRGEGGEGLLVEEGLAPNRPYLLIIPQPLLPRFEPYLTLSNPVVNRILRLEPSRFHPEMNTLVVSSTDRTGSPRAEIRAKGEALAVAGVNWRSPIFAEVFVNVQENRQRRGWGRSLVNAVAAELVKMRVTPLYNAAEGNSASLALAEQVGFVDTGAREVMVQASRA